MLASSLACLSLWLTVKFLVSPALAHSTGCYPSLGTGIRWQDCLRAGSARPHYLNHPLTFTRCHGQRFHCDPFSQDGMPQGNAFGTCAFGIDLLGSGPSNPTPVQTTSWAFLNVELTSLVSRCVTTGGGLGGNHTWGGFVFVVANPMQIDTANTCMALPGPEEYLDLGQCLARRAEIAANGPSTSAMAGLQVGAQQLASELVLFREGIVAGHQKGVAWIDYRSAEKPTNGRWRVLKPGIANPCPPGSPIRAYVNHGLLWKPYDGRRIPDGGAMIRLPDSTGQSAVLSSIWWPSNFWLPSLTIESLPPLGEEGIVVQQLNVWIPTIDSATADPNKWWVWLSSRWTPLSTAELVAAEWILQYGAWHVIAKSWYFSTYHSPLQCLEGVISGWEEAPSGCSSDITTSETLWETTSVATPSVPPTPSQLSLLALLESMDDANPWQEELGSHEQATVQDDDSIPRATKRPRIAV